MAQTSNRRDPEGRRRKGAYAVGEDTAGRRPGWLIPLLALLALVVIGLVLFFLLRDRSSDSTTAATTPTVAATSAGATGSTAPTASVTVSPTASAGPAGTAADGQLLAGGQVVLPLAAGSSDLSQYAGQSATARTVSVQSVPADEGFWVGSSATDRVWVQLTGAAGESPVTVKAGDRISFAGGKVVATPTGFAAKVGVDTAEGSSQLTAQKAHVEISKTAIKLTS